MKNFYFFCLWVLLGLMGCGKDEQPMTQSIIEDPPATVEGGSIFLDSSPQGAEIYLMGTNTGKVTPGEIINLDLGNYDITLKLKEYADTSFSVVVHKNIKTSKMIALIDSFPDVIIKDSVKYWQSSSGHDTYFQFLFNFSHNVYLDSIRIVNTTINYSFTERYSGSIGNKEWVNCPSGAGHFAMSNSKGIFSFAIYGYITKRGNGNFTITKQIEIK